MERINVDLLFKCPETGKYVEADGTDIWIDVDPYENRVIVSCSSCKHDHWMIR